MAHGNPEKRRRTGAPRYWACGPSPSTPRGKRRHARREEAQKKHAEKVWRGGR